ncbi:hypothetical protein NO559_11305 [Dasania sp. GY-MA-18]|uniref:Secreted protein n=1 Tax=Dasania phycosphaerae TaxID=2950436 RepID=A0A9J6RP53_9GAMM|nr:MULTISPECIES: hypothetical protein [Dasania]MCR8923365.1 hypothetical protein [Dasania sp. GY-MA-18]MCZ0865797.1 hypothetical protein [Dasania phycosphaerae]MCZ0869522.1 hypothetical protein [Dasania phycosphaerae]
MTFFKTLLSISLSAVLLSACDPVSNNSPANNEIEKHPPPVQQEINPPTKTAGFCSPGNPNTPNSQLTGRGEDCDEEKAKRKATSAWVSLNCSGNADPQCPSGCVDPNKKCQSYPGNTSNLTCTSRDVSASVCANRKKYSCEIVRPDLSHPISCSCKCL